MMPSSHQGSRRLLATCYDSTAEPFDPKTDTTVSPGWICDDTGAENTDRAEQCISYVMIPSTCNCWNEPDPAIQTCVSWERTVDINGFGAWTCAHPDIIRVPGMSICSDPVITGFDGKRYAGQATTTE